MVTIEEAAANYRAARRVQIARSRAAHDAWLEARRLDQEAQDAQADADRAWAQLRQVIDGD